MDLDSIFKEDSSGVKLSLDKPLTIEVGNASITVKPSGEIVLKGMKISVEGTSVKIAGQAQTEISASGMLTLKSSMLKLN